MFYRTRYVQEHYTRSTGAIGEINGVPKPDQGTQGKEGNHTSNTRSWHREYLVRKKRGKNGSFFRCGMCALWKLSFMQCVCSIPGLCWAGGAFSQIKMGGCLRGNPPFTKQWSIFRKCYMKTRRAKRAGKNVCAFFRVFPLLLGKRVHCLTEGEGGLGGCLFFGTRSVSTGLLYASSTINFFLFFFSIVQMWVCALLFLFVQQKDKKTDVSEERGNWGFLAETFVCGENVKK